MSPVIDVTFDAVGSVKTHSRTYRFGVDGLRGTHKEGHGRNILCYLTIFRIKLSMLSR